MAKKFPTAVKQFAGGQAVDYTQVLVGVIGELSATIAKLEERLVALENR